jgi:hypothetical protein
VANRDARQRRLARANDVETRRDEMGRISQRRNRMTTVWIAREDCAAGARALRRDWPVVAARVRAMLMTRASANALAGL